MSKILCLNNGYPTDVNPQYTTYVHTIATCLRRAGHDVDLLVIRYDKPIKPAYKAWKYLRYWLQILFRRFDRYDIVYINHLPYAWPAVLNKSLRRTKVYVHWHGEELVSQSQFIHRVLNFLRPRMTGFCHIVPSHYFKQRLMEIMGISSGMIAVSPSGGVDTAVFRPLSDDKQDEDAVVVGFSSALTQSKGADMLLKLMRAQDEIERTAGRKVAFKVIDYGREATYYTAQFRQATERVEIVGKMPKSSMPMFYNSISVLLMGSIRESLGLVVLEAMSCGRPVVTYDLCAFPEFVVSGESGELAHYSTDEDECFLAVKEAIIKVIANYGDYHPRDIVLNKYSEESVVAYYRTL